MRFHGTFLFTGLKIQNLSAAEDRCVLLNGFTFFIQFRSSLIGFLLGLTYEVCYFTIVQDKFERIIIFLIFLGFFVELKTF